MKAFALPALFLASAALAIGLFELLGTVFRKPKAQDLLFVAACLTSGLYALACAFQYNSVSVAGTVGFLQVQFALLFVDCVVVVAFFALVTKSFPRWVVLGWSAVFVVMAVTQAVGGPWLWQSTGRFQPAEVLGFRWVYPVASPTAWTIAEVLVSACFVVFLLVTSLLFWKKEPSKGARLLPIPVLIALAFLNDLAVAAGWSSLPPTLEYAFLGAVIYIRLDRAHQERETDHQLHRLAFFDPLTGLENRSLFRRHLAAAISRGQRFGQGFAVLFLDLDRFKYINDSFGHEVGDAVLNETAQRFRSRLRENDVVARLGGDEFTFLLEGVVKTADAASVAQTLLDTLDRPVVVGAHEFFPGASIGIAFYPSDDTTAEGLTSKADAAMYEAKRTGGNTYRFVQPQTHERNRERLQMESELRRALEDGDFRVYYQPLIDLETGACLGAEALLRWQRRSDGVLVFPGEFIQLAEETGLIVPIGLWVLETACAEAAAWSRLGHELTISVNFSPKQFVRPELPEQVAGILARLGLDPRRLLVEVTESTLIDNFDRAQECLNRLNALGCRVALDDFGTGYSSLSYLARFRVNKLKIDQSFIHGILTTTDLQSIVKSMIGMAKNLGILTVGEGIEDEDERKFLSDLGCDVGQGFLFGKAVDAPTFRGTLVRRA